MPDKYRQKDWTTVLRAMGAQIDALESGEKKVKDRKIATTQNRLTAFKLWGSPNTTLSEGIFEIDCWTITDSEGLVKEPFEGDFRRLYQRSWRRI